MITMSSMDMRGGRCPVSDRSGQRFGVDLHGGKDDPHRIRCEWIDAVIDADTII